MKVENIDVTATLDKAKEALDNDKTISSTTKVVFKLLLMVVKTFLDKFNTNSSNSSKPPSSDLNRLKKKKSVFDKYRFFLMLNSESNQNLEQGNIFLSLDNGNIIYTCLDLDNNIVHGKISQEDLPEDITMPESNEIESFNKIKKTILDITAARGHTENFKRPGGQPGHNGTTLQPVENPDEIIDLAIDKRTLSRNKDYKAEGYLSKQVVNINISRHVIEYRAEIFVDNVGNQYIANFPEGVTRPIQYGTSVKSHITYLSVYQLIPYKRIEEQFTNEYEIPISSGSISNFIVEGSRKLKELNFPKIAKSNLLSSPVNHADETGINVNGTRVWLHCLSNNQWSYVAPHEKRGTEAMNDIDIIPHYLGTLCHDHWKPYYTYNKCLHSLCNAHHLRELTRAFEQDGQKWAKKMHAFLLKLKKEVEETDLQCLPEDKIQERQTEYRKILSDGEKECPLIAPKSGTKRKPKQSKSRNLLTRLIDYEADVLRFMVDSLVPFTNNLGEREIRMNKVQQKISGCFRSMEGAENYSMIRSYLSTCKKHGIPATEALDLLFNNKLPEFMLNKIDTS